MNLMNTPKFLITSYFNSEEINLEQLRKTLYEKGVLSKDYPEEGLILLYHKFESPIYSDLERECRSLIIDRNTLKIKSYSCETPKLNKEGMEYLIAHSNEPTIINPCYEGTYLSVFKHNNKWYVSTRRCLNSNESIFNPNENQDPKSHFDMFDEILKKDGYSGFSEFSSKLDENKSYYFVLIHHLNKHFIDYSQTFGTNYGKICLTSIRDSNMNELNIYEDKPTFLTENIFMAEKMDTMDIFANSNKMTKYDESLTSEGVIVRIWNTEMNKYNLIKLQNINYQFYQVIGPEKNIFKGLIYLYQNDKLMEYFQNNPNTINIKKIVNPLNTSESYDTIGMVDAVFKVCTSELFELFKVLWSIKNGKHQNKDLYELLPKEYKDLMFAIRGLYYKKKAIFINKQKLKENENDINLTDIKNTHLKINDIYNYLKSQPTDNIVAFLRMRKLMLNWIKSETSNIHLQEFNKTSLHCDKVLLKLSAIFTYKLYPNIMPNDLPPFQKKDSDNKINLVI